ncbi:crotonase/enoyl-CoA hydratase family protein [Mycobacterium talmoniae]|uniref:2,3-dehydroadipyl-CoA hydratase n=1 Tax=Mycobacterium talmoniae TaxID=1858794 RepID=A0A1S1NFD6_9MYCO|nr:MULTISPECIES: crotonase/enoyl-CoA hydratase family protein [Mycobacterium]OHV04393.1 enoyl-CoA hydratase [Mycobacterium talmoniae]PQM46902.1 2,3-dehydroadipyl-CoA hydratase [Mycobacterium talmoniae]TDH54174.1 crotonase/enoyl-CoA hydratase family protein [Mycobacterium eburneum]
MSYETLQVRRDGHVQIIGLNRPEKRNAFDAAMLRELAAAYGELDADDTVRVGVLYGEGTMFTAGLDLASVAGDIQNNVSLVPDGGINPWQVDGRQLSKPLVAAVHGKVLTLGIELMLAADIAVAAESATFAQLEIARGIYPFGGATIRFPRAAGWGNAMRWMLTAETFDAAEAHRIGIVQEVVADGQHLQRALDIAHTIARQAPLGVQATLRSARQAIRAGEAAAEADLVPGVQRLFTTEDAAIGVQAFVTRTPAEFVGR